MRGRWWWCHRLGRQRCFSPTASKARGTTSSDLSTLFQDDACTVPVTTTGDPVGCILDKSRNGNGLIQTTADNRPVYQSDGVNRWLQFDVTNDGFSTGSGSSSSGCGVSWLLAVWVRARAESLT